MTSRSSKDEPANRHRKQHKKSRAGCSNCKQKRIKCDEIKPACGNCTRRFDRCSFLENNSPDEKNSASPDVSLSVVRAPSRSSSSTFQISNSASPAGVDASTPRTATFGQASSADFELWHNFLMNVGPSLASEGNDDELHHWQTVIPGFAFKNQHVMGLLLALSAFHLQRSQPHRTELISHAEHLYGLALPVVIEQLSHLGTENCETLYLCSMVICFLNFSRGPQAGQYIAFSDGGGAEWFTLLRGVRLIMDKYRDQLAKGILAKTYHNAERKSKLHLTVPVPSQVLESAQRRDEMSQWLRVLANEKALFEKYVDKSQDVPARPRLIESRDALGGIKQWLEALAANEPSFAKYEAPLVDLNNAFRAYAKLERGETEFPIVFGWLYRISDAYVLALQAKKPIALVIFAFYCILLRELEDSRWLLEGWSAHTLEGVIKYLHPEYHRWVARPREVVR